MTATCPGYGATGVCRDHAMDLRQAARRHGWQCDPADPCQSCRRRADLNAKADRCQQIISLIEAAA